MTGKYQKYMLEMKLENKDYTLWKGIREEVLCYLETYKEKRAVFFRAANLLPSSHVRELKKGEYHLILLGVDDGRVIHRDFGSVQADYKGEASLFQKFTGPALSCYTHCVFACIKEGGQMDVVFQGETPFFTDKEKGLTAQMENSWERLQKDCYREREIFAFTKERDETKARWYRFEWEENLPKPLQNYGKWIKSYRHYIFGMADNRLFVGIPGRFLKREQPEEGERIFVLWQPMRGGEHFFDTPENMTLQQQEEIFGYWLAEIVMPEGRLCPV